MAQWIATTKLVKDARDILIPRIAGVQISAVAGVPRSGMILGSCLSTLLSVPLMEANKRGLRPMGFGARMKGEAPRAGKLLIVDDSCYTGGSLREAVEAARKTGADVISACAYLNPDAAWKPDVWCEHVVPPRFFEWNFFCSGHMSGSRGLPGGTALDFDGIICKEDGRTPLWVPRSSRFACRAIITGRLEVSDRDRCEEWLARHEVKYDKLVMHSAPSREERGSETKIAEWKASVLRDDNYSCYVESSVLQARIIKLNWQRGIVLCPPVDLVLT